VTTSLVDDNLDDSSVTSIYMQKPDEQTSNSSNAKVLPESITLLTYIPDAKYFSGVDKSVFTDVLGGAQHRHITVYRPIYICTSLKDLSWRRLFRIH